MRMRSTPPDSFCNDIVRILNCMCIGEEVCDGEDYCTEFEAMVQKNAQFLGCPLRGASARPVECTEKGAKLHSADDLRQDLHVPHPGCYTAFAAVWIALYPRDRGLAAYPPFVPAGEFWRQDQNHFYVIPRLNWKIRIEKDAIRAKVASMPSSLEICHRRTNCDRHANRNARV